MADHQETIKGYKGAGDCEVKSLKLITTAGQVIDISSLVVEMSFYENLFNPYLQCDLVINDSLGMIQSFQGNESAGTPGGFTGGEVLVVSYKTNSEDIEFTDHAFGLYELGNRQRIREKSESYKLSGISMEYYANVGKQISRGYGGQSGNQISKMVESILEEYFNSPALQSLYNDVKEKSGITISKENTVDPTNGLQRLLVSNKSVEETLAMMGREADCDNHVPFYIFFENSDGFQFRDINALIMADDPEQVYTYEPMNANDTENQSADSEFKDPFKIESYYVIRENNFMDNAQKGLYRQKTINVDLLRKKTKTVDFRYSENVDKFQKLNGNPIAGDVDGDGVINLTTSRLGHDTDPLFGDERVLPKRINQFASLKGSFFAHNFNTKLEVTLPGDSTLKAGDKINISIPAATNTDDADGTEDKYLSGIYLIASVRQKMSGNGDDYRTIIQCAKDTGK